MTRRALDTAPFWLQTALHHRLFTRQAFEISRGYRWGTMPLLLHAPNIVLALARWFGPFISHSLHRIVTEEANVGVLPHACRDMPRSSVFGQEFAQCSCALHDHLQRPSLVYAVLDVTNPAVTICLLLETPSALAAETAEAGSTHPNHDSKMVQ